MRFLQKGLGFFIVVTVLIQCIAFSGSVSASSVLYGNTGNAAGCQDDSQVYTTTSAISLPSTVSDTTGRKFLVVVSKPIYDYGYGEMAAHLNVYQTDLEREGWSPRLITVDNTSQTNPEFTCATPDALKSVIRGFYNEGYEGFVLIGSHPHIPTAFWSLDEGISSHNICTDLFYSDMNDWGPMDSDGAYVPVTPNTPKDIERTFHPDMIYGRISAGCITDSIQNEAGKVIAYLNKIHNYRVRGSDLEPEQLNRSLALAEGDFKGYKSASAAYLRRLTPEVVGLYDDSLTTSDRLEQELERGYKFYFQIIHSLNDYHCIDRWTTTGRVNDNFTYQRVTDPNNPVIPKVHYLNLASCFACQYNGINVTSSGPVIEDKVNIGAAYLFNSDYVFNVSGQTGGWGLWLNDEYYQKIANGTPIGDAFVDYIGSLDEGGFKGIILGDPTLRYGGVPNNMAPYITTDLAGKSGEPRLYLKDGVPFTIEAQDLDLTANGRNDTIEIQLSGNNADSTAMLSTANIVAGNGALTWTPTECEAGKIYNLTVTAFNRDANNNIVNNKYTENFTVAVVHTYEAESGSNTLSGGAAVKDDSACSGGKKVWYIGNNSGQITFNNILAKYKGIHTLRIAYQSGDNRTANIKINDNAVKTCSFSGMGNWNDVGYKDILVVLSEGYNTISIYNSNADQWAPDIDSIQIISSRN